MKDKVIRLKNHVVAHRATYTFAVTSTVILTACAAMSYRNMQQLHQFFVDHDIDPNLYYLSGTDLEVVAS